MRSLSVAPLGAQVPRVRHAPSTRANAWEDIADLARAYGLILDPWQENVLQAAMGERSDGQWASPRVGLAVPRQNGKGAIIEARELAGLLLFGEQTIIHSAHDQKTARIGFDRIASYFENYDDLRRRVKQVGSALNREYIELRTGQTLRFLARSKSSGRGFSADCLMLDEAQELSDETWAAILPTISARPNPQIWLLGTPPAPGMAGEVFTRFRTAGLEGKDGRLCWCEWSVEADSDLDDRIAWVLANPSLGADRETGVTYESIADERHALDESSFGRERLGMWDEASGNRVIDTVTWDLCADDRSTAVERLALAIDVPPDRSVASVALAGLRADGKWHVELYEQRKGVGWVVPYVVERLERNAEKLPRAVVIDGASPAASLIEALAAAKVKVTTTAARDMAKACGTFYDGVMEGWLRHTNQPQVNTALGLARKRTLGDAWAWNRRSATSDITPLVACTLALWGAQSSTVKKPGRRGGRSNERRVATVL
jgi:phage terminase large subunit-like protein